MLYESRPVVNIQKSLFKIVIVLQNIYIQEIII